MSLPGTLEEEVEEQGERFGIIHFGHACVTVTRTQAHTRVPLPLYVNIGSEQRTVRQVPARAPRIHFQGRRKEDGEERRGGAWGGIKGVYLSRTAHIQCVGKVRSRLAHFLSFVALLLLKKVEKREASCYMFQSGITPHRL
ncbi:hypothetical protein AMECASPLE_012943 [Ameca splendens]|uniref:Uncharacterized protein n=1 Tax=Ameca splendens TaxID=208324 RepID=A0ABV0ZKZ2_9TELE